MKLNFYINVNVLAVQLTKKKNNVPALVKTTHKSEIFVGLTIVELRYAIQLLHNYKKIIRHYYMYDFKLCSTNKNTKCLHYEDSNLMLFSFFV